MPNHVYNVITITGPAEVIELLDRSVQSEDQPFDFQRIVPRPVVTEELASNSPFITSDTLQQHPASNAYDWQLEHWGTKWNAYEFGQCAPGEYSFCTAWDPPLPVIQALSGLFPDLRIAIEFRDECEEESQTLVYEKQQCR